MFKRAISILILILPVLLIPAEVFSQQDTSTQYPSVYFSGLLQPRAEASLTRYVDPLGRPVIADTPAVTNFRIRRAYLKWDMEIAPRVTATIRLGVHEFDNPLGRVLHYAYATYKRSEMLNFTIGQHKVPFSGENLMSAHRLFLIDRGTTNSLFGRSNYLGTDIGLQVYSAVKPKAGVFNYHLGIYNGNGSNLRLDVTPGKSITGRISYFMLKDFSLGASGSYGRFLNENVYAFGGDILFRQKISKRSSMQLNGEYMQGINLPEYQLKRRPGMAPENFNMNGWFIVGKYNYLLNHKTFRWVDFGARYEMSDPMTRLSGTKVHTIVPHVGISLHPLNDIDFKINIINTRYEIPTNELRNHNLLVTQMNFKF